MDYDPDRSLGLILSDTARLMRKVFDRRMAGLDLTRAQWSTLIRLHRQDGLTQAALAELMEIEPPTMGRAIDRLEAAGWVERRPDPADRRAKRVFLTPKAHAVVGDIRRAALELRSEMLDGLPEADRERLIDMLLAVKANLARLCNGGGDAAAGNGQ